MQEEKSIELVIGESTDTCLQTVTSHFSERGLAQTARREAEEQQKRESETRGQAPLAYRLSEDENGVSAYRDNEESMTVSGLLRYAGESRAKRIEGMDFSADAVGIYELSDVREVAPGQIVPKTTVVDTVRMAKESLKQLPEQTVETVKKRMPLWFDPRRGSTENETRRFPLSAFAAVAAVAISMMLIVAGSLMVIGAETQISRLNRQISDLHEEISDLRSDMESSIDLIEIRRIATEEYGMVGEEFLKMDYIELDRDEIAEVKGDKRAGGIGLAGLLSAIGWK